MKNKIINLGISNREADELLKVSKNIEKDYEKLKKDYPIQYLIGYVNFYGYNIKVNKNVLIPRFETEFLVDKTINYAKKIFGNKKIKIIDLGTGSGAISVAIAKNLNSDVTAVDISNKALSVAKKNFKDNNIQVKCFQNDMLEGINEKFDIVISNPPYIDKDEIIMDSVRKYEPNIALFAENNGLYYYEKILSTVQKNLSKNFIIAFEIGYKQFDKIKTIINKYFNNVKIICEKDLANKDRYIFIINE